MKRKGQSMLGLSLSQWGLILLAVIGVILFIIYYDKVISWAKDFIAALFGGA